MTKRVPIAVARRIATELDLDQVIIVAFSKKTGMTHVVTYGKSIDDCEQAAQGGNKIKDKVLGWPDELCHAAPRRIINRKAKETEKLRKAIKRDMDAEAELGSS